MYMATQDYCLVERRQNVRRKHFDRRDKARFEPNHPDRRHGIERRQVDSENPSPTVNKQS